ncbi:MAG: hypothetical protein DRO99_03380, partial [Candidatus Aenigmatarchaeota archaeon]
LIGLPQPSQALNLLLIPNHFYGLLLKGMSGDGAVSDAQCITVQHESRIDNRGNVSPCCTMDDIADKLDMGNVLDDNFINIWLSPAYTNLRNNPCKNRKCKVNPDNFY